MAGLMQFWGLEVKAKVPSKVSLGGGSLVHISQVTLGPGGLSDLKKDNETVMVHVKVGEKKLVLAILSKDTPQRSFDLVFDEDFEISHNWKNGDVHLLGYQNESVDLDSEIDSSDEEMEDVLIAKENGQVGAPAASTLAATPMVIKSLPEVNDESSEEYSSDDDDDDDDDDSSDDDADDVDTNEDGTSVSEGDEDDSDDSEEETPAKVADAGKKRPNAADAKTPPQAKKAKVATPQKTDGKKGGQPKTPAGDKTPKSGGSDASCGSCKKSFKSGTALESHNKAKHGAK